MYKKNDILKIKIVDIGSSGEGIGKTFDENAFTVFAKDTIIGDIVNVKLMKVKKNYAYGHLEEIIEPSDDRVNALCDKAKSCGGCQLQEMSYEAQKRYKEKKVIELLNRVGNFDADYLKDRQLPMIGMKNPWHYRNKAQYPVSINREGKIIAGFYAGRTHSVVECKNCKIGPEYHKILINIILDFIIKENYAAYDEKTGKGLLRHILIRDGFSTGEVMVVLVLNQDIEKENSKRWEKLALELKNELDKIENKNSENINIENINSENINSENINSDEGNCIKKKLVSFQLNENTEKTNVILGKKCRLIYGKETITDILNNLKFEISPLSFYQVNPVQTKKLYDAALEFASLKEGDELWDICCGAGTITLSAARLFPNNKIHGIEIVPEAIENACNNAKINNISNVEFICAAAEDYMPKHKNEIRADVIIVDPPRKGMDERALETMVYMNPSRIVYVSCDPATLARDLKYLSENGYGLEKFCTCDMFPHSSHVESVVLMSRKDK